MKNKMIQSIAAATILATVITVVYQVHPAFKLTYSPLVVILAFFILGLSAMVASIIFLRFEKFSISSKIRNIQAPFF